MTYHQTRKQVVPHLPPRQTSRVLPVSNRQQQRGFALISIVIFLIIIGTVATGGVVLSTKTESLAGNAIQRNRSFQAADGAATLAERQIESMMTKRIYADDTASKGIYARDKRGEQWWRTDTTEGVNTADATSILGVVSAPTYVIEEVGDYISDGGTGVVNLDIGGSAYGRASASGREILLFSVESHGNGSFNTVETIVETTIAFSY